MSADNYKSTTSQPPLTPPESEVLPVWIDYYTLPNLSAEIVMKVLERSDKNDMLHGMKMEFKRHLIEASENMDKSDKPY